MRKSATWFVGAGRWIRWLAFLFLLGIAPAGSMAQLPTAAILGVVKDSSGAVVPGVSLTAQHVETGQVRTAVSGGDGSYRFSALAILLDTIRQLAYGFGRRQNSNREFRLFFVWILPAQFGYHPFHTAFESHRWPRERAAVQKQAPNLI